ncbi:MAG: DUF115 domain-containing protein [Alphaproteobacteria bacterium]|nr:DUF115 domain-containing protein [Alphaproteobacteria bacterium]
MMEIGQRKRLEMVEALGQRIDLRIAEITTGYPLTYPRDNTNLRSYADWEFRNNDPASPQLIEFYSKYKGQRCFIIGNGPTLNKHDLSLLHGEKVFAVNSFFYKTRDTGFKPTFFVVEDEMVMRENHKEFQSYDVPYKFFPTEYKTFHPPADNVFFFRMNHGFYQNGSPYYNVPRFSADPLKGLYCGQSVTYINLQLAFFMGFSEVYLIGMDFDYVIPKEHIRKGNDIISTTDDPNHFHKEYFGVGKTWRDPKLENVAINYRLAKVSYEAVGRRIYNATIGGKLEIFDRVDYEALLRDPATGQKRSQRIAPVVVRPGEGASVAAPDQLARPPVGLAASSPRPQAAPGTTVALSAAPPQKHPEPTAAPIAGSSPAAPAPKPVTASVPASEALLADSPSLERKPIPQSPSAMSQSSATDITPPQPPQTRPWYAPMGDALRSIVPGLYPTLQEARRALWRLAGYPLAWMSGLGALGVATWAMVTPGPFGGRMVVAGAALGALAVVGLGAMAWRLRRAIQTLSAENRRLAEDIAFIHELASGREGRVDQIIVAQSALRQDVGSIRTAQGREGAALRSELAAVKTARSEDAAEFKQEISGLKSAQACDVSALQSTLSRAIEDARAGTQASLQAELKRLEAETGQEIDRLKAGSIQDAAALKLEMSALKSAQARDVSALQSTLSRAIEDARAGTLASLQAELKRLEAETGQVVDLLKAEIVRSGQSARTDSEAVLRSELLRLKADQAETSKALREEIVRNGQEVRDSVDATLLAELTRLETVLAERASAEAAALREALGQLQAELDQKMKARAASTGASFGRAAKAALRRETALKEQIAALQAALSRIEDETASAQTAAAQGDAALREELKAVRQGLEQRLRAEIDEAMAQSVGDLAERIDASARGAADDDAQLREDMAALREALEQRVAADVEALRADALAQAEQRLAAELEALEQRLTSATGDSADALRQDISALQAALKGAENTAASAQTAAAEGDAALREELKAVRQGLEQRLRAEIDEAMAQSVGELAERIEASARGAADDDAQLREDMAALREAMEQRLAADVEAGKADALAQAEQRLAAELDALEQRLTSATGDSADALRQDISALQAALKGAENNAAAAQTAAAQGDAALRDELKAVRQGLEQRLRAEIDEATAERVASLLQRIDAAADSAKSQDAALRQELEALRETSAQSDTELETSLKSIQGRLATAQAHSVSLHVTSALRSLRPLWTGASAVQALKEQAEVEHGHELLMALLADEERASPGALAGKTLIEIGTTRENVPSQSSTQKLAIFAALTGLRFITVDMDPANTAKAKEILKYINPGAQAVTQTGETYLRQHPAALEFVYLDAFDFDHGQHSEARQASYRKYLGTEISDPACWKMHEDCAETILARMVKGGIVVLDDTWTDEEGRYAGKGKLAAPLLLENGFSVLAKTRRTLALRNTTDENQRRNTVIK